MIVWFGLLLVLKLNHHLSSPCSISDSLYQLRSFSCFYSTCQCMVAHFRCFLYHRNGMPFSPNKPLTSFGCSFRGDTPLQSSNSGCASNDVIWKTDEWRCVRDDIKWGYYISDCNEKDHLYPYCGSFGHKPEDDEYRKIKSHQYALVSQPSCLSPQCCGGSTILAMWCTLNGQILVTLHNQHDYKVKQSTRFPCAKLFCFSHCHQEVVPIGIILFFLFIVSLPLMSQLSS